MKSKVKKSNAGRKPVPDKKVQVSIYIEKSKIEKLSGLDAFKEKIIAYVEYASKNERSAYVNIVDSDIATIEALHDLLLDKHDYKLDFITLKRARELIAKMYDALYLSE